MTSALRGTALRAFAAACEKRSRKQIAETVPHAAMRCERPVWTCELQADRRRQAANFCRGWLPFFGPQEAYPGCSVGKSLMLPIPQQHLPPHTIVFAQVKPT